MSRGLKVELFLVSGNADGLIIAEIDNWSGKALKISRSDIKDCDEEELCGVGVYLLFGRSDKTCLPTVYVGEAENVKKRLVEHIHNSAKEDYDWNTAVCFFGNNLNKAHVRFLERRLKETAERCGRCEVMTKHTFSTSLKRSEECSMLQFMEYVEILTRALGYDVFTPQPSSADTRQSFQCFGNGAHSKGFLSQDGFTVMRGSIISDHTVPSFAANNKGVARLREELIEKNVIKNREFMKDYEFSSVSAASCLVLGRPSNGKDDWKWGEKKTLGEYLKTI